MLFMLSKKSIWGTCGQVNIVNKLWLRNGADPPNYSNKYIGNPWFIGEAKK